MTARRAAWGLRAVAAAAVLAGGLAASAAPENPLLAKARSDAWRDRYDACVPLAKDGSAECVKALARLARDDTDTLVRDEAVSACRHLATDESVDILAEMVGRAPPLGRRNLVAGLARTTKQRALDTILRVAGADADPWVRSEAVEAAWYYESDPRALDLCKAGMRAPDVMVRAAAANAASHLTGGAGRGLVVAAWSDADEGVRCAALRAMGAEDATVRLAEAAAAKGWRLRAQCAESALRLRTVECVDVLIGLAGDPVPRVGWAAVRALRFLTGKDFGTDPDVWRAWWQPNRTAWIAPKGRPTDAPEAPPDPKATRADFVGVPVETTGATFVIDHSSSMATEMKAGGTRAEAVGRELVRTLGALPDGFRANVVLFGHEVHACWNAAKPLTTKARAQLAEFTISVKAEGRTDLVGGVLRALADDTVDTIYVLTDGVPSDGDVASDYRVRTSILRANRTRKVVINTIGFGVTKEADRKFVVELAADSGGRCVLR